MKGLDLNITVKKSEVLSKFKILKYFDVFKDFEEKR